MFAAPHPGYVQLVREPATAGLVITRCTDEPDRSPLEMYIALDRPSAQLQTPTELTLCGRESPDGHAVLYGALLGLAGRSADPALFITASYGAAGGCQELARLAELERLPGYLVTGTGFLGTLPVRNLARQAARSILERAGHEPRRGSVHFLLEVEALRARWSDVERLAWILERAP